MSEDQIKFTQQILRDLICNMGPVDGYTWEDLVATAFVISDEFYKKVAEHE